MPTCSGTGVGAFLGVNNTNVAGGSYSVVGGGQYNQACDGWSTIAGGYGNAVSGTGGGNVYTGFIGGGEANVLTGADEDSAIVAGYQNALTGEYGFIGGGSTNTLSAEYGVVVGGSINTLSAEYGVLVGGLNNTVSGEGAYIAAGGYNTASGEGAVVDGGFESTAAGTFATIPGGYLNSASAARTALRPARSAAPRTRERSCGATARTASPILTSSRTYQFLARASGGFTLYTNADEHGWRAARAPVRERGHRSATATRRRTSRLSTTPSVLAKVAALPISRWSYKTEHGVRHVGPMAQDFYAAFGVGEDDKHITSIDEDGVALAAIKALHARVRSLGAENVQLRARLAAVKTSQSLSAQQQARRDASMQRELDHLSTEVSSLHGR